MRIFSVFGGLLAILATAISVPIAVAVEIVPALYKQGVAFVRAAWALIADAKPALLARLRNEAPALRLPDPLPPSLLNGLRYEAGMRPSPG
jgi:mannose/fructose/N-acetylgalactosamine-specific phosphotransferase system component IIC